MKLMRFLNGLCLATGVALAIGTAVAFLAGNLDLAGTLAVALVALVFGYVAGEGR